MSISVSLEGLQKTFEGVGETELTRLSGSFEGHNVEVEQDKANQALIKTLLTEVKSAIGNENKLLADFAEHRLGELGRTDTGHKSITMSEVSEALKDIRNQADSPQVRDAALSDFTQDKLMDKLTAFNQDKHLLSDTEAKDALQTLTGRIDALKENKAIACEKLQTKATELVDTFLARLETVKSLEALQANFPIDGDSGKTEVTNVQMLSKGQDPQKLQAQANKDFIATFKNEVFKHIKDPSIINTANRILDALGLRPDYKTMRQVACPITVRDLHHTIENLIARAEDRQERQSAIDSFHKNTIPAMIDAFEKGFGIKMSEQERSKFTKNMTYACEPKPFTRIKDLEGEMNRLANKHLSRFKSNLENLKPFADTNPAFFQKSVQELLKTDKPMNSLLYAAMLKTIPNFKPDSLKSFLIDIETASTEEKMMMFGGLMHKVVEETAANLPPGVDIEFGSEEDQEFVTHALLYQLTMPDQSEPSFRTVLCARLDQIANVVSELAAIGKPFMVGIRDYNQFGQMTCGVIAQTIRSHVDPAEIQAAKI